MLKSSSLLFILSFGSCQKASILYLYVHFVGRLRRRFWASVYLLALPPVSQAANRNAIRELGPANTTVPIFEQLMDSRSIFLTANDNTPYTWTWLDLRNGPLVVEVPPKVLGAINDMWYRWVIDVGITGPDKGQGGKYLLLPPGYQGKAPS